MRIILKKSDEELKEDSYCINEKYVSVRPSNFILYPIPEGMEMTCACGVPAITMNSNFEGVCKDCLNGFIKGVGAEEKHDKVLAIPSIKKAIRGMKFEWMVQGKDTFYSVRGSRIVPKSVIPMDKALINKRYMELMTKILAGENIIIEGFWDKEDEKNKKLLVYI